MNHRIAHMSLRGILAGTLLAFLSVIPAAAASSTSASGTGYGMKVSPVTTNLMISPGQSQTVNVYVTNVTGVPDNLQPLINDFTANGDESGTPALFLNNQYAPSHSLKRFIAPIASFTLQPGEEKTVPVTISIPNGTSGGGYYGAIRFVPVTANGSGSVSLSASVGSLILVKVPGKFTEDMHLLSFEVQQGKNGGQSVLYTTNKNLYVTIRIQNAGDVQEQPFGKVLLQSHNTTLNSYEINNTTPAGNVLPGSIRKFSVALDKVGLFGKYTVIGNFGYGTSGQLLSAQTTFYVVQIPVIVAAILVILVVLYLVFVLPKQIRRHGQRAIQKAHR